MRILPDVHEDGRQLGHYLQVITARNLDRLALALTGILLLTLVWAGASDKMNPLPEVALLTLAATSYVLGRLLGARFGTTALLAVAHGAVAVVVVAPGILSGTAQAPPLLYGNANGALLAIGVVAGTAVGVAATPPSRLLGWSLASLLAILIVLTKSQAATGLALLALASTAAVTWTKGRGARAVVAGALLGLMVLVGATIWLGAAYDGPGSAPAWAARTLSERRVALWHDAVSLAIAHPLAGVGPGRFPTTSPVARADPDTRFAHSLPLELGAEDGVLAGVVAVLLVVTLALAGAARRPAAERVVATWAVVVFAAQASMDYTYRFPAVVLAGSLVAGLCSRRTAARLSDQTMTKTATPPTPPRLP